jgi:hypothetical protein
MRSAEWRMKKMMFKGVLSVCFGRETDTVNEAGQQRAKNGLLGNLELLFSFSHVLTDAILTHTKHLQRANM